MGGKWVFWILTAKYHVPGSETVLQFCKILLLGKLGYMISLLFPTNNCEFSIISNFKK